MSRLNFWKFKIPNDSFLWSSHLGYDIFDIFMWLGSFGIYSPMKLGSSCPVYRQKAQTCGTHCGLYPACGQKGVQALICLIAILCSFCELLFLRAEAWACSFPDAQDSILNPSWKKNFGTPSSKKKKKSEHKNSSTHKWVCHKMWTEEKVCKSRHSS